MDVSKYNVDHEEYEADFHPSLMSIQKVGDYIRKTYNKHNHDHIRNNIMPSKFL